MRTRGADTLSGTKIKSINQLRKIIPKLKSEGKRIVFTNGCFDILHFGHVQYLEKAKKLGEILIVGLNNDASVRKIKGQNRPIVNEKDRAKILSGLESVNFIVLFGEQTPLETIKAIKPDILIKGADWNKEKIVGASFVTNYGGKVQTVKLAKGRSTTTIIEKIAKAYAKKHY